MRQLEVGQDGLGISVGLKLGFRDVNKKRELAIPAAERILYMAGFEAGDVVNVVVTNGVIFVRKLDDLSEIDAHDYKRKSLRSRRHRRDHVID